MLAKADRERAAVNLNFVAASRINEARCRRAGVHPMRSPDFYVADLLRTFKVKPPGGRKVIECPAEEQYHYYYGMQDIGPPYLAVVTSPSGVSAKDVAIRLADAALKHPTRSGVGSVEVIWHSIGQGLRHLVSEDGVKRPCGLLVVSGLSELSTEYTLERVRQIVDLYSDTPRILTFAADSPAIPYAQFGRAINYTLNLSEVGHRTALDFGDGDSLDGIDDGNVTKLRIVK